MGAARGGAGGVALAGVWLRLDTIFLGRLDVAGWLCCHAMLCSPVLRCASVCAVCEQAATTYSGGGEACVLFCFYLFALVARSARCMVLVFIYIYGCRMFLGRGGGRGVAGCGCGCRWVELVTPKSREEERSNAILR